MNEGFENFIFFINTLEIQTNFIFERGKIMTDRKNEWKGEKVMIDRKEDIKKYAKNRALNVRLDDECMNFVNKMAYEQNISVSGTIRGMINIFKSDQLKDVRQWIYDGNDMRSLDEVLKGETNE